MDFGTRATGLVFSHMPSFLAKLNALGNPKPDPGLNLTVDQPEVTTTRGATTQITVTLHNTGPDPVHDLRLSFHPRLDFTATTVSSAPQELAPGQTAKAIFELTTPEHLNLTCDYNRIAYAHASITHERDKTTRVAHAFTKIIVK